MSIQSSQHGAERFAFSYDENGNTLTKADVAKNLTKTMVYDHANRIVAVKDQTGKTMGSYAYDDQGFRVKKIVEKEITQGDGSAALRTVILSAHNKYFISERQAAKVSGRLWNVPGTDAAVNNIYLNGVRIAAMESNGAASYYLANHVDSVKAVTDDTGAVTSRTEYLPYGETFVQSGDLAMAAKYNGQALDEESDFYFFNARHYDPEVARFATADTVTDGPETIKGWNRYMYVAGNPVMYKDPTGHIIEITGDTEFIDKVEQDLQKISPAAYVDRETNQVKFDEKIKEKLAKEKKFTKGNELLTRLVESKETIFVEETEESSKFSPSLFRSSKVKLNFEEENNVLTRSHDPRDPGDSFRNMPSHIVLAHELIHADNRIRDNFFEQFYNKAFNGEHTIYPTGDVGHQFSWQEYAKIEELRTVGLGDYNKPGDVTENDIRKESGLGKRLAYGGTIDPNKEEK